MHTFKDNYVTRAKALDADLELTHHVDEIVEQAKESMAQDAIAIWIQARPQQSPTSSSD